MRRRRAYCNYLVDEPEVSLPLAPPVLPELVAPLAGLELELSEDELDDGVEVPPAAPEPYCFTQSSRSVPVMPTHWLGSDSVELPAVKKKAILNFSGLTCVCRTVDCLQAQNLYDPRVESASETAERARALCLTSPPPGSTPSLAELQS